MGVAVGLDGVLLHVHVVRRRTLGNGPAAPGRTKEACASHLGGRAIACPRGGSRLGTRRALQLLAHLPSRASEPQRQVTRVRHERLN
eukprot:3702567-Alexandrium_andersonii.AAC.1